MVLANLYFQDIGSTQTLIFSPNSQFHFLHQSQQSLHHVYFLQFSLISVRPLHCDISLWNLKIALVTYVPRVIIITLVLFGKSKAAYWLPLYSQNLFCNPSQRTVRAWLKSDNVLWNICLFLCQWSKTSLFQSLFTMSDGVERCWVYTTFKMFVTQMSN